MNHECVFCFARQFKKLLEKHVEEEDRKLALTQSFFQYLSNIDTSLTTPYVSRDIHAMFRKYLDNPDPYKNEKKRSNELIMSIYSRLQERVDNAPDPFREALMLSIAGNMMDFGPSDDFSIHDTLSDLQQRNIAIDHSQMLKEQISVAESVLYLGDNAGEMVFDKLFLETINHPHVYYAVKGSPVINDVTIEDAKRTEIDQVAQVIDNGYDAPSTLPEMSSAAFRNIYQKADLIISKGQGNFEGLMYRKDPRIFFLLIAKCQVIADYTGSRKGDILIYNQAC